MRAAASLDQASPCSAVAGEGSPITPLGAMSRVSHAKSVSYTHLVGDIAETNQIEHFFDALIAELARCVLEFEAKADILLDLSLIHI